MKQVTALVVTYNRLKLLKENIAAITAQTYSVKHILVIDNNSQDGTKEYLDSLQIGGLIVKHLAKNLGGSGGFYEGIKIFEEQLTDDFVWIMDDDTIPTSTALKRIESVLVNDWSIWILSQQCSLD
jgi:Predicted glycosyltransferases